MIVIFVSALNQSQDKKTTQFDSMELNQIYNMDCLEGLKKLESQSIDLVLTDPPYNIDKDFANDNLNSKDLKEFTIAYATELKRVIKPKHPILIFYNTGENFAEFLNTTSSILKFKKLMILYKPNDCSMPLASVLRTSEALTLFSSGEPLAYQHDENTHDVLISNVKVERGFYHPSVKNIYTIRKLVLSFTQEGALVLDCFMGSGTTALACKQLGRNYIGFEINAEYCKMAEDRLKRYSNQGILNVQN